VSFMFRPQLLKNRILHHRVKNHSEIDEEPNLLIWPWPL
jgi:hypothetical protein